LYKNIYFIPKSLRGTFNYCPFKALLFVYLSGFKVLESFIAVNMKNLVKIISKQLAETNVK